MASDSTCEPSWGEEEAPAAFRWLRPQRPEEPVGVRDVGVDPFSLRHFSFSRVDIDRPLPIPSVSVDDHRRVSLSPSAAQLHAASSLPAGSASSATAGGLKKPPGPTAPAWWEWDGAFALPIAHSAPSSSAVALPRRSKLSSGGGDETEVPAADAGFDVALMSSSTETERKAVSEPQRWGSDVPLMAAAADADEEEEYSFGGGKDGKHAGNKAPFTCCMFVPGLTRWTTKPPPTSSSTTATAKAAAKRSSSSGNKLGNTTASSVKLRQPMDDDPGTACSARRASTMAVSLERFDCGALSPAPSSPRGLDLSDGEATSASAYFDLPLELILSCDDDDAGDDADLPVCAAFLFDSDGVRKSVLKRRLQAAAGWEPRRPSLGKVSVDASSWVSNPQVRVSLKSRSP